MNILTPIKEKLQKEIEELELRLKEPEKLFKYWELKAKLQAISEVENLMKEKIGELKEAFIIKAKGEDEESEFLKIIRNHFGDFE
jgi:hypothetical protein